MDLRQLEIFVAVADTGSFSQAAERLFITQPTVSAHISRLEDELGALLFNRSTRSLTVSEAGRRLYPYAASMLELRAKAELEIRGVRTEPQVIRIGASTVPAAYILPAAIAGFGQEHPEISFEIARSDSLGIVDRLVRGELDIGLVGTRAKAPGCLWLPLFQDELVLVTPCNEHFIRLGEQNAELAELMREPVILREPSSGTRQEGERLLCQVGVDPSSLRVAATFDDPTAILNSIIQGVGVSVMSRLSAEEALHAGKVLIFPLSGGSAVRRLYIVRREGRHIPAYVKDFIAQLVETGKARQI